MNQYMCKYILIFVLVFGFAFRTNAQNVDSLYAAFSHAKDKEIKDNLANNILYTCNRIYNSNGDYGSIKPEPIIELAYQYKNDTLLANYFSNMSILAVITGDNNKSLELACKSLKYYEKIKDTLLVSFELKEIGLIYKEIKNYPEAIDYYTKAIDMVNTLNTNKNNRWVFCFNYYQGLARIYLEMHNVDSAFNKLQYAYAIFVKHEKEMTAAYKIDFDLRLNFLNANLYLQKKDTILAETYFKKCFAVNTDSVAKVTAHYLDACLLYSNFKKDLNDYKNAAHYASLAYNFALKRKQKKYIADASEQLYKLYKQTQQTDSAYFYLQLTLIYKDSMNSAIIQSQIQNTTLLLHFDEKEKEVKLAEETLKHKKNVQYAAGAIGIIILLLVFFVFSHSIIIGTKTIEFIGTIILLMVFEFIDLYIHPYIGIWSNESPLIMLLVLVFIAALLIPIHHKIEHWTTRKLVEKNKKVRLENAKKTIKELDKSGGNNLSDQL